MAWTLPFSCCCVAFGVSTVRQWNATETLGCVRGPKDHIDTRILHSGSKARDEGIPETMLSGMLRFTRCLDPYMKWARRFEHEGGPSWL